MATFKIILFIVSRIPRIISLLKELWAILNGNEAELEYFLQESEASIAALKKARDEGERHEARKRISDLVSRL